MTTETTGASHRTVLESWSSLGEKTVFVLDRSRYFTHVSSGHLIEGDSSKKNANEDAEGTIPPFDRSLWTCAVEAVVGYSRLVWDLFTPEQRCISMLAVGPNTSTCPLEVASEPYVIEKICTWRDEDQNLEHLFRSLAKRSHCHQISLPQKLTKTNDISAYPNCDLESYMLTALDQALTDLGHLTRAQMERRSAKKGSSSSISNGNYGRVILISSFRSEEAIQKVVTEFEQGIARKNSLLSQAIDQDRIPGIQLRPIDYCDLVIVNTFPIHDEGPCSKISDFSAFKPKLHVKTYSVRSGRMIAGLLDNLCLQHNNLKSTTITGIPMKEEQSASSSSQYDVEIAHCSSIHEEVLGLGDTYLNGIVANIDRNGFPCKTFKLNWCTPKLGNTAELQHCMATSRITSVDVNSRPSACLTNFLLNGKQVMLEIFKSKSNRMITHVLASHGGELYIHSLATSKHKQNMGDPPPLSENLGGKVGDYRVNDFVALMKQHTLVRPSHSIEDPLSRTCNIIDRQTLYWPLTLGHTILWNVRNMIGDLLVKIPKELISQTDVDECKQVIDNLVKFEKDGHGLPSTTIVDMVVKPAGSSKAGASKLEQLYKLLWNELEYFLRVHSTTPEHEAVLDHLLERHGDRNHHRGTKRSASKQAAIAPSPMKKQKVVSKLIPEISDEAAVEQLQQTAMFYKTGMSVFQTWSSLYHQYHRMRSKLPFACRTK
uniref:Protein asunder n=1 Tax=Aceria tosichella TaxID=561515 RepID=A0A6G1SHR1_9ACAR